MMDWKLLKRVVVGLFTMYSDKLTKRLMEKYYVLKKSNAPEDYVSTEHYQKKR